MEHRDGKTLTCSYQWGIALQCVGMAMKWMANSWKKEMKDFERRNVDQLQLPGEYLKADSMNDEFE